VSDTHHFHVSATWDFSAKKGHLETHDGSIRMAHAGASVLGGTAGIANPEELLVAAVSACFVQTWAIFIEKLKLPIEKALVGAGCVVEKDPAGGFHVTSITIEPHIPAAVWADRKDDVEKTLALAEKYCIVSKAVKAGVALSVKPKTA
jgi:organic hydroperoxide reductase OsmC/OhrA